MKTIFRILGILLGSLVVLLLIGATFIHFRGIPQYPVNAPEVKVELDSARIARGEHLAAMVCANCHRGDDGALSGRKLFDIPKMFGEIHSANITQHPVKGIGSYTDGELVYLLRTGIKRNGQYSPTYMPKFVHMSDEDIYSVIAYLRSDAPAVQAADKATVPCKPSLFTKFLTMTPAFKPFPMPEKPIEAPDRSDEVAYGKYIVHGAVECYSCHSADFTKINTMEPEKSLGYMGGGNTLLDPEGNPVLSANITMHPENGIGSWTLTQFTQAIRTGQRPDGKPLSEAMPKFTVLTDEEISAMWAFMKTIPVSDNKVKRTWEQ